VEPGTPSQDSDQKDMAAYVPYATSFAEIDAARQAAEKAEALNQVVMDFQTIAQSVLYAADLDPAAKAKALRAAATEVNSRLSAASKESGPGLLERLGLRRPKRSDPPPPAPGSFRVYKDAAGRMRWVAVYSNNLYDREGEVIPLAAHKSYVEYVDRTNDFPELWLWHTPGTRVGAADLVDVTSEGFAIASGTFDEDKGLAAEALAAIPGLGVSHGFEYGTIDEDGAYDGYRTYEISPLPKERAANEYTGFAAGEEIKMLNPDKKSFIAGVLGAAFADKLEADLDEAHDKAVAEGVAFKDVLAALEPDPAPAPPSPAPAPAFDGEALKTLLQSALAPIVTAVEGIATRQDEQQKAIDDLASRKVSLAAEVAKSMSPKNGMFIASQAARGASEEDDDVKAAKAAGIDKLFSNGDDAVPDHLAGQLGLLRGILGGGAVVATAE
jgi:hypothetical protein